MPDRNKRTIRVGIIRCDIGQPFHGAMYVSAIGPRGKVDGHQLDDWRFPEGAAEILKLARKMVRTGKAPVPSNEMLECIAAADAVRRALKSGSAAKVQSSGKPKRRG